MCHIPLGMGHAGAYWILGRLMKAWECLMKLNGLESLCAHNFIRFTVNSLLLHFVPSITIIPSLASLKELQWHRAKNNDDAPGWYLNRLNHNPNPHSTWLQWQRNEPIIGYWHLVSWRLLRSTVLSRKKLCFAMPPTTPSIFGLWSSFWYRSKVVDKTLSLTFPDFWVWV